MARRANTLERDDGRTGIGKDPPHEVFLRPIRVRELVQKRLLLVNDGYRMRNSELGASGIAFVRGGDIEDGWINHNVQDHIREEFRSSVESKLTQAWDVAFITKGTVGRVGLIRPGQPPVVFAPQVAYWRSLAPNVIHPRFIFYLLSGRDFQNNLDAVKTHGAMAADYVSISQQLDFDVVLPRPAEQRAIAHILGALDDKIELNRKTNETLEAMARALFQSWFVDFDPVRAKAAGRAPEGMDEATAKLFPSEFEASELGEVPKGWRVATVGSVCEAFSGGTPSKGDSSLWGGDLPWISPKVMTSIHADEAEAFVTEAAVGRGTRLVPAGTVLVMVRGMGLHQGVRVCRALRAVTLNQDVKALVPRGIPSVLLLYALLHLQSSLLGKVESAGNGTGRLPSDVLLSAKFIVAPSSEQLAGRLGALDTRIALLRDESRTLAALRDALLPKLLSGELAIRDAETFVSRAV